ncbi:MAG: Fe-S cluster assembly protein SufD [Gammaproteobacteria bacterium]|jgi:Fe-S cluster assembly protein SufD|nr:MAG: Fe-S cluster assembly protein SufD [Gammaproteobacteria bacterium]
MSQEALEFYVAEHARTIALDTDWLHGLRQSALSNFRRAGFPDTRQEDWRYTDVRPILKRRFVQAGDSGDLAADAGFEGMRFAGLDAHELAFINGHYDKGLSRLGPLPQGVILTSLAEALIKYPQQVKDCLANFPGLDANGFQALNTAFLTHGTLLYVPAGVTVATPVHLIFRSNRQPEPRMAFLRNLIVLGRGASLTVIEDYSGTADAEYMTNVTTCISGGEGASLRHYKLQGESQKSYHIAATHIRQARDCRVESCSIALGGALVRNDITASLDGEGAEVALDGLYMGNGRQHVDNHTWIHHRSPHTTSREEYKGVLNDHARAVFNGKVIVHEHAQKADARQANDNLLLSDNAEIDTKPELEIHADDVKCSHGATIGQLDENMLFYLRSRAVDADTARSLLIFAFADAVVSRIGLRPIRERLEAMILGKLPDSGLIKEFVQ